LPSDAVLTKKGRRHFEKTARHHSALVRELFLRHFARENLDVMASCWARLEAEPGS
jgi:hypothetical protein